MFRSFEPGDTSPVNAFRQEVTEFVQLLIVGVASVVVFIIGFRRLLPEDLFSTALFFDSLEIAKVFSEPARLAEDPFLSGVMNALAYEFADVSVSAMSISLFLAAAQLLAGYFLVIQGEYATGYGNAITYFSEWWRRQREAARMQRQGRNVKPKPMPKVSRAKFNWLYFLVFLASVDTMTDILFRSVVDGVVTLDSVVWSTVVSLLVYNLGSEWGTVVGFTMVATTGYSILVRLYPLAVSTLDLVSELTSFGPQRATTVPPKGRGNRGQQKQQQQGKNRGRGQQQSKKKGRTARVGDNHHQQPRSGGNRDGGRGNREYYAPPPADAPVSDLERYLDDLEGRL